MSKQPNIVSVDRTVDEKEFNQILIEIGEKPANLGGDADCLDDLTEASGLLMYYQQSSKKMNFDDYKTKKDFDIGGGLRGIGEDEWYRNVICSDGRSSSIELLPQSKVKENDGISKTSAEVLAQTTPSTSVPDLRSPLTSGTVSLESTIVEESLFHYLVELVLHLRKSDSVRGKQSRLTMWEILEHFDFLNDLFFICRVGMMAQEPRFLGDPLLQRIGSLFFILSVFGWFLPWLTVQDHTLFITELRLNSIRCSYLHVPYKYDDISDTSIFYPFFVFSKIRSVGGPSPETLYTFERLSWTYQLVMRLFEDIPQLVVSAVFLANFGQNFYTYFMIAYSCMLMLITSVRMGLTYPLFGTLSLIMSRAPPVDSPVINEACPTTRNFALFVSLNFVLWCITNALCLCFVKGIAIAMFTGLSISSAFLSAFFAAYWIYLTRQSTSFEDNPLISDMELSGLESTLHEPCI